MLKYITRKGAEADSTTGLIYLYNNYIFVGAKMPKNHRVLFSVYSAFLNVFCLILAPIAFSMGVIALLNMDISVVLYSFQSLLNVWGIPLKIITVLFNFKKFAKVEQLLQLLDARCTQPREVERLKEISMKTNRIYIIWLSAYILYGLVTFLTGVVMGKPPFSIYIPFVDWYNSHLEFLIQMCCEFITMLYLIGYQVANDSYPVLFIYFLRMHIGILIDRISQLCTDPSKSNDTNYKELKACIVDHQILLQIFDMISSIVSNTLFIQFSITACALATCMINITVFSDSSTKGSTIVYFIIICGQIAPCCFQATYLIADNNQLSFAIFHSNWIEQDARYLQLLIFFLQKSQKTLSLSALKIFAIDLNTGINIAKFSFSLYTLLKDLNFTKH